MMKKTLFSLLLAAAFATTSYAEDYNYLNIFTNNGGTSVALKSVKKITFSATDLIVYTADGAQQNVPLADLTSLTFNSTATGISDVSKQQNTLLTLQSGRIVAGGNGTLAVFNSGGQMVRSIRITSDRTEVSLDGLPHGLYIARIGNRTLKIVH